MLSLLAAGILLLVLFLFAERKAREPILPLDLFRNMIFSVGALLALLQNMVLLGLAIMTGAPAAWGQEELYVTNFSTNSITVYERTANGNVAAVPPDAK